MLNSEHFDLDALFLGLNVRFELVKAAPSSKVLPGVNAFSDSAIVEALKETLRYVMLAILKLC